MTHSEKDLVFTHEHFDLTPREDQLEHIDLEEEESQSVPGKDAGFMSTTAVFDVTLNLPTSTAAVDTSLLEDDLLAYLYPLNNPFDRRYFSEQNDGLLTTQGQGLNKYEQRIIKDEQQHSVSCRTASSKELAASISSGSRGPNSLAQLNLESETVKEFETTLQVSQKAQFAELKGVNSSIPFWSTSFGSISCPLITNAMYVMPPGCPTPSRPPTDGATLKNKTVGPMNFSHFSRPAALAKAALQNIGMHNNTLEGNLSVVEETTVTEATLKSSDSGIACTDGMVMPCNISPKVNGQCNFISSKGALNIEENTDLTQHKKMKADGCQSALVGDAGQVDNSESESMVGIEPTITTSSGGSGIGSERCQERDNMKENCKPRPDLPDNQNEDVETEPAELKKSAPKATRRRKRAAEIHNLAERRRRDRINEKMKALQELIPNCSKTDKASILDEAIDYVKTLQAHLQIMSVRTGVGMSPMLLSTTPQHSATNGGIVPGIRLETRKGLVDMQTLVSAVPLIPTIPISRNMPMPSAMGAELHRFNPFGLHDVNGSHVSSELPAQNLNTDIHPTHLQHQH